MNRVTSEIKLLARHQLGGMTAGAIDFLTMIGLVELLHASPVLGTALGAAVGAVTNFIMSRRWIFVARGGDAAPQAARYALVSACSLGLNTLGEHLVFGRLGVQYVLARAIVAVLVSLGWNFPLQRFFVFPRREREPS